MSPLLRISVVLSALFLVVAVSSAMEAEFALVHEKDFDETVKFGRCIVLFDNMDSQSKNHRSLSGSTPPQFVGQLMREVVSFRDRIAASIQMYKVQWKDRSTVPVSRARSDADYSTQDPRNPVFVTYDVNGAVVSRIKGTLRPAALPMLVHGIMDYYIHSIRTDKGDFLRSGWLITDTNASFVNLVNERKEDREFNGKTEQVQVISYVAGPYEGTNYNYERIYAKDGRLLGSIESYGPYGKFGYFDYDRTGKFQYRVRYPAGEGK